MDKKKFRLQVPSKPYVPGFQFSTICHPQCVPRNIDRDSYFHGAWIVGEEKEEEEYIEKTECSFCHKL